MEATEQNTTNNTTEDNGKTIAIIAYITLIGLIVAFVMNNEKKLPFAQYHIRQSLGLMLTGVCLWIVGIVPILGWIISILGMFVMIFMWIMGLINALNNKQKPIPLLGKQYEKWFANV